MKLDKSGSGGSTCSLGSSPGASFSSSLTVPDYSPGAGPPCLVQQVQNKITRSTSPFNIKARVKRRREKRLEKQSNLTSIGLEDLVCPSSPAHGSTASADQQQLRHQGSCSPNGQQPIAVAAAAAGGSSNSCTEGPHLKERLSSSFRFKDFRKRSKESLSLRRNKNLHMTVDSGDNFLTINAHSAGTSPEARSPRSPVSPGQCKCRRCSLLPLEECEPKEVSALFKFLRKSKVCCENVVFKPFFVLCTTAIYALKTGVYFPYSEFQNIKGIWNFF